MQTAAKRSKPDVTSESFRTRFDELVTNVEKVIKGKTEVVRMLLVAIIAEGHILLEDMPGTGKTMLASSLARTIDCRVSRIQCTPDLLPSDVTGSPILEMKTGEFRFREGPVFANVVLVDEINRSTPKTQSALLEAMQERTVTIDGTTHSLPHPFIMIATQNPIELAGTFPLPEAQLDRFMFKLSIGYPDREAEAEVAISNRARPSLETLTSITDSAELLSMSEWVKDITISRAVTMYIVDLVQATRTDSSLLLGASSRAVLALHRACRVLAAANGREDVYPDDVKALLTPVLAHRLILTPDASLRDETIEKVLERIIGRVKPPVGAVAQSIA